MAYEKFYQPLRAVNAADFNTCYYCGCVASGEDFVPPLAEIAAYKRADSGADFIRVPACGECARVLKHCSSGQLALRVDFIKRYLTQHYAQALRVYQMWESDELAEMDAAFRISLAAGMRLGEEAQQRLDYPGFRYEVDGHKSGQVAVVAKVYAVHERAFADYKSALNYAHEVSRIPKGRLAELYLQQGESFDKAIRAFQQNAAKKAFERELKDKCKVFAAKHVQHPKFIERTVRQYLQQDDNLSIAAALEKLRQERFAD